MSMTMFFGALALSVSVAQGAIFGADDRHEVTPGRRWQTPARATAVAVLTGNESFNPDGSLNLAVDVLPLCANEPMVQDPSLSYSCTAFLVAPDLLVTAGHCLYAINTPRHELRNETGLACEAFDWLFDYEKLDRAPAQTKNIDPGRLFHCKRIIYAKQDDGPPFEDYALIQLDRPVPGGRPFKLAPRPSQSRIDLSMLGYPLGTPLKLTDHGRILRDDPARSSFITNLDAAEGNSGSPVFNAAHEVVGILVGGTPTRDTYVESGGRCERFNRCDEEGRGCVWSDSNVSIFPGFQTIGSEVQRIIPIVELLRANGLGR